MTGSIRLDIEPLRAAAFAPFGEVLCRKSEPPDFHGHQTIGWRLPFDAESKVELMIIETPYHGRAVSKLERHHAVTQAFIPLTGSPSAIVVGPDCGECAPPPNELRAFYIDGDSGYILRKDIWHSIDRFPLQPPGSLFVIITDRNTNDELIQRPPLLRLTQEVDYLESSGVSIEINGP